MATVMRSTVRTVGSSAARARSARLIFYSNSVNEPLHPRVALAALNDPLSPQRRLKSTQTGPTASRKKPTASPPSFGSRQQQQQQHQQHDQRHGRDGVVTQLQKAVARATGKPLEMEFLRHATTLLQAAQTPNQLRAALPLCRLVENADTLHGSATAECVRIYEALGRNRDAVELALRLLRHDFFLVNPVLTSALQACASLRDSDRAFELFELAVDRGTIPNRNVFGTLLALSATAGDTPHAPRVTQLLAQMNHSDTGMNHTTYHHWMMAYAKADNFDVVDELFETSEAYGLEPVAATYAILMDAFAERGDYDKTMALLSELRKTEGLDVGLVHYNIALKVCGKTSKLTQAFYLYEEMKDKKIAPDLVTYITMMHAVYHGELGVVDTRKVKAAMGGVGAVALASVPFINFQEQLMTFLFCTSLVGSMGLAVYMNPDGAMRALYPNSDEPQNDTVIEAFFRRLREEDHCGRSMYLWREMLKHAVAPDSRVYDVLVRTCVKKRHPELAFEAVFEQQGVALVDAESGQFVLPLATTVSLLHSLLAQRRLAMADTVFDAARSHRAFGDIFREVKDVYAYDLRTFNTATVRSYVVRRLLTQLHTESKLFGSGKAQLLPRVELLVHHGYDLLDQLDMDDPQVRALFSMDEMKRETAGSRSGSHTQSSATSSPPSTSTNASSTTGANSGQFFFRLSVSRERLAAFFAAPLASATQQKLLSANIDLTVSRRTLHCLLPSCVMMDTTIGVLDSNHGEARTSPQPEKPSDVQVSCRLRGLSPSELAAGRRDVVSVDPADPQNTVTVATATGSHAFRFNHVFSTTATQQEIFQAVGAPCLRDLLGGYNCTLLAYGQTGSGKTHTTIGGGVGGPNCDGLVPRLLEQLFGAVAKEPTMKLTASFVEVYQERLCDLLVRSSASASSSSSILRMREDKVDGGVWVDGATEIPLLDLATARAALRRGLAHRSMGATQLNSDSSRSHAVFAVTLTRHTVTGETVRSRLCVVDLAGSEQAKKTRASGMRLDEAKHINRSLSALGNVIHALTSTSSNSNSLSYVPYRDSKLTRLLQSSLGGNAKTHLLLTCATACCHTDESLSTLRFGARAKRMRNKPTVNINATPTTTTEAQQRELLETLQRKVHVTGESLCRYIRELEDAAASSSCRCGSMNISNVGDMDESPTLPDEDPEVDRSDPGEEDVSAIATTTAFSNDLLMQAELLTLRKTLDDIQRLQRHEQALEEVVESVEHNEIEKLHERQTRAIEQLDAQLTLAESEIASLQRQLREQLTTDSELKHKLTHYQSLQRRDEDAAFAETEILRRRLEHSETLGKSVRLELAASRAEAAELRERVEHGERERTRMHDELLAAWSQIHMTHTAPAPAPASPLSSPSPPRCKPTPMLRPVTVAAAERNGSSSAAIQSWWAGETLSTNNSDEEGREPVGHPPRQDDVTTSVVVMSPKVNSAGRCSTSITGSGRPRLDTVGITDHLLRGGINDGDREEGGDRKEQLHTSGGTRPFRARLVGLLNSLEAETSSYKELLQSSSTAHDGSPLMAVRPRPVHPRSQTRRHRLPELSASTRTTTPLLQSTHEQEQAR